MKWIIVCKYITCRQNNLERHLRSVHDVESCECKGCGAIFEMLKECKMHIAREHPYSRVKYITKYPLITCSDCDMKVSNLIDLIDHYSDYHN